MFGKKRFYQSFSLVVCNTFVLFLGLNLLLGLGYWSRDQLRDNKDTFDIHTIPDRPGKPRLTQKRLYYQMYWVDTRSYENYATEKVDQILDDFYDFQQVGFTFQPYVQFSVPPFQSKTLNFKTDSQGFTYRSHPQARSQAATKPLEVIALGGSTLMGWNVDDNATIPSHWERLLTKRLQHPVRITNYAMPFYSWNQELILFQRLLHAGRRPDVVVFVDGINTWINPKFSEKLRNAWERQQYNPNANDFTHLTVFPLFRAINAAFHKKKTAAFDTYLNQRYPPHHQSAPTLKQSYLSTLHQANALAKSHNIEPLFFWQPHRAYQCNTDQYGQPLTSNVIENTQNLYDPMAQASAPNYLYSGDLCQDYHKQHPNARIIIDDVHYSPRFNAYLAEKWATALERKLVTQLAQREHISKPNPL